MLRRELFGNIKSGVKWFGFFVAAFLIIGNLLHRQAFPESQLEETLRPRPGFVIQNKFGETVRFRKTAASTTDTVEFDFFLNPGGLVPVYHIHDGITEIFSVSRGTLTIRLPDGEHQVVSGQTLTVPAGTPHQPRNLTDDVVEVRVVYSPAGRMDEFLTQFFGLVNEGRTSATGDPDFLQMMLFSAKFDIYLAGPPILLQKVLSLFLAPVARLAGYRSVYPGYFSKKE